MTSFRFRRQLRTLQKERERIEKKSRSELQRTTGEKRQELEAQWSFEFFVVQEQIEELLSDNIRERAEGLDISLPPHTEGEFWERMNHVGDRLILTTRGREEMREKIRKESKQIRDAWGFYFQMVVTIGSLIVAALAIYFRK
jgi:hypothetical protein